MLPNCSALMLIDNTNIETITKDRSQKHADGEESTPRKQSGWTCQHAACLPTPSSSIHLTFHSASILNHRRLPDQQPELPAQPGWTQLSAGTWGSSPTDPWPSCEAGPPTLTNRFKLHLENIFSQQNATTNCNSCFCCLWWFIGTDVHYFKHELIKKNENHILGKHQNDSSSKHVTLKLESTLYNSRGLFHYSNVIRKLLI